MFSYAQSFLLHYSMEPTLCSTMNSVAVMIGLASILLFIVHLKIYLYYY